MFNIGDLIIYASEGVCKVEDIGCPEISSINKERIYYTLSPLYRDGKIYTPVDTGTYMRHVMTREQVEHLINQIPIIKTNACSDKNLRAMSEHYDTALRSYDCADLIQLIKTIYAKKLTAADQGKRLGQTDERYMRRAEEMLHGEFAVALGIERDAVRDYIDKAVNALDEPEEKEVC